MEKKDDDDETPLEGFVIDTVSNTLGAIFFLNTGIPGAGWGIQKWIRAARKDVRDDPDSAWGQMN